MLYSGKMEAWLTNTNDKVTDTICRQKGRCIPKGWRIHGILVRNNGRLTEKKLVVDQALP